MTDRLRLRAVDAEDLAVMGRVLRDARVPIREMAFDPDDGRFMAAFARDRREASDEATECTTVLVVEHVRAAHWCGLAPDELAVEHRLLTVVDSPSEADDPCDPDECEQAVPCPEVGDLAITLYFHDGAAIRLAVDRLECRLMDVGEPRPAADAAEKSLARSEPG